MLMSHMSCLNPFYPKYGQNQSLCVDFSFCCITFDPIDFSLEQNILFVSRMKACLETTSMFCSREKSIGSKKNQSPIWSGLISCPAQYPAKDLAMPPQSAQNP